MCRLLDLQRVLLFGPFDALYLKRTNPFGTHANSFGVVSVFHHDASLELTDRYS